MQIFEYPYIIITIFVLCFLLIGAIGIFFAISGVKTAQGDKGKAYISVSKLENSFEKAGKLRENRCVFYIGVNLDNYISLYSEPKADILFSRIKDILLNFFNEDENGAIAVYGEKNFVALNKWTMSKAGANVEKCQEELNRCLLNYEALNVVSIIFGSYFPLGNQISFDDAINRAKQAYLHAKNQKLTYVEWNIGNGKALEKKIKIENNIENEIDNNRFFLEYQPVLDAKTKKIIGAEVLARLNSESEGVLAPGSFLSAVDSVGINNKFDYYIFEKNCKWISNHKKQREKYKYTINFSRTTLCEPTFAKEIINIADKYDLDVSCLAVEVLEDKNITGEARVQMIRNLTMLKEKGFSILLDDFGSGYTTFSDLQSLDISIVKVDKSLTHNATSETGFIILKNIIATSTGLGFKTLCEGIETKEQEEAVIKAGCDYLQGFYYYRPMPVTQLEKLFEENSGGV